MSHDRRGLARAIVDGVHDKQLLKESTDDLFKDTEDQYTRLDPPSAACLVTDACRAPVDNAWATLRLCGPSGAE